EDRNDERPVAAEEEDGFVELGGFAKRTFVESHGNGEAMMVGKRCGGVDFDAVAGDGKLRVLAAGAVGAGGEIGPHVFGSGGKCDGGGGGVDGNVPLVTGDVPVELVEVFVEFEAVGDGVFDIDGLNGVVGVVEVDFEFAVVTFARGFVA